MAKNIHIKVIYINEGSQLNILQKCLENESDLRAISFNNRDIGACFFQVDRDSISMLGELLLTKLSTQTPVLADGQANVCSIAKLKLGRIQRHPEVVLRRKILWTTSLTYRYG
jgi:hypothetical protein